MASTQLSVHTNHKIPDVTVHDYLRDDSGNFATLDIKLDETTVVFYLDNIDQVEEFIDSMKDALKHIIFYLDKQEEVDDDGE
jgi:hypothetical protein